MHAHAQRMHQPTGWKGSDLMSLCSSNHSANRQAMSFTDEQTEILRGEAPGPGPQLETDAVLWSSSRMGCYCCQQDGWKGQDGTEASTTVQTTESQM